jgi:hypothetical protein
MPKKVLVALFVGFIGLLILSDHVFGARDTTGALRLIAILFILGCLTVLAFSRLGTSRGRTYKPQSPQLITESTLKAEKDRITSPVAFHYVVGRTEDGKLKPGYMVGMVALDRKGYIYRHDLGCFPTIAAAEAKAAEMNALHGLSEKEAYRIVRECI